MKNKESEKTTQEYIQTGEEQADLEEKNRKRKKKQMDMLHGSLWDKLLLVALPLAASSILQQLFNSADVAVVGRFASSHALAAVGGNSAVINLLINLFVGLAVGANVVIGNYIGQGKRERLKQVVQTVMLLAVVSGLLVMVVGIAAARPVLELIQTPEEIIDSAMLYLRIYMLGMPFIMVYNFGAAILRSVGDTKRPLVCLIISGVINVILNLILVIEFKLDVAGVAIATLVSNIVSSSIVVYILMHEEESMRLTFHDFKINLHDLGKVLRIGMPAGVQGMVFSLSNVCIQSAINSFGPDAIAGSAAALNFEYCSYFVINAFNQTTVTFTSQNFGAKQYDRCKKVYRSCMMLGMIFCAALSLFFILGRRLFIQVFTVDPPVIEYAMIRMTHVMLLEFMTGSYEISGAALRGMGYSILPTVITILGSCGFRVLWLYTVFKKLSSFDWIMNVYPVSWILTGAAMILAYMLIRKRVFASE